MTSDGRDEVPLADAAARFEQRARQLLLDSVESLPAQMRSRLTRARYAAASNRPSLASSLMRHWKPASAGALAAAVLAVVFLVGPQGENPAPSLLTNAAPEDLEMLTDSDAVQLGREGEVDYDFYEWAVQEAQGANAPSMGT
jgi:hypothetical protein